MVYVALCTRVVGFWIGLFTLCVVFVLCCSSVCVCSVCVVFSVTVLSFFCLLLGFLLCVCSLNPVAQFFIPCMLNGLSLFVSLILGLMFVLWIAVMFIQAHVFLLSSHISYVRSVTMFFLHSVFCYVSFSYVM